MALLCNLHADGPLTLRRLRESGCGSLTELRRLPLFDLARILAADVGSAQRFVREAQALEARLGAEHGALEPEEVAQPAAEIGRSPTRSYAHESPQRSGPRVKGEPLRAPITVGDGAPARAATPASGHAPGHAPGRASQESSGQASISARAASAPNALRPGLIEGLDESWCRALIGQGVLGLEALRDAPALALARSMEKPLTRLVELQCFARRALEQAQGGQARRAGAERAPRTRAELPTAAGGALRPVLEPDYTIFPPQATRTTPVPGGPRGPSGVALEHENEIAGPFA